MQVIDCYGKNLFMTTGCLLFEVIANMNMMFWSSTLKCASCLIFYYTQMSSFSLSHLLDGPIYNESWILHMSFRFIWEWFYSNLMFNNLLKLLFSHGNLKNNFFFFFLFRDNFLPPYLTFKPKLPKCWTLSYQLYWSHKSWFECLIVL